MKVAHALAKQTRGEPAAFGRIAAALSPVESSLLILDINKRQIFWHPLRLQAGL
jgi:hypothetical protein